MSVDVRGFIKGIQNMVSELAGVEEIKKFVVKALNSRINPVDVMDAVSHGMNVVGEKYEKGEYFLSELIMAGIIAKEIMNTVAPYLNKKADEKSIGKVVIGTVKGDLHDIGKNIVIAMLSSMGFIVKDLGIDVPCKMFVKTIENERPNILAMSCLLTSSMNEMRKVIEELSKVGLRENIKVMVGGRPVTPQFAKAIGADAYGANAFEAVKVAKALMKRGVRHE
ncbi:MAG: cobalamin-dependent protein [Candidatus Bathyarchaeota archaeon]|nr:cobalamin-dependent protein [Candidatus Bathyarchaeota archaeon]